MHYISTKEAAEKWGVSARNVQRLLMQGRLAGAKKYGNYWMIPADSEKPQDPRRARKRAATRPFYTLPRQCPLLIMTTLYTVPGSADAVTESLAYDAEAQTLFRMELTFLRGDIDGASALLDTLPLDAARPDLFSAIAFWRCMCALHRSDVQAWLFYKQKLQQMTCRTEWEAAQRDFWLGSTDLALYDVNSLPDWFCAGDFDPLPKDAYPTARFSYIKYAILTNQNAQAALLVKPLLSECRAEGALVAEIYGRAIIATSFLEYGDMPAAIKEIDRAIELALPDRLYAPLADYRDNLGTLLDERLALTDKEALKAVKALSKQVSVGWAALNRELRGLINTTNLTQQEHHAAKLAVKGLTNAEIAERMHVSVNTIKRYISEAISKTGARDRSELVKYLAMEFLVE